jgi:hypothetical protein
MACYNCGNECELPKRSATAAGGGDFDYYYCEKCGTYLGAVRVDGNLPPNMRGFGWIYGDMPTAEQRKMLDDFRRKQK